MLLSVSISYKLAFLSNPQSIVCELARHLDLNSLHNLSLTCRQVRANLQSFRHQLVTRTLRCANEGDDHPVLRKQLSIGSGLRRLVVSPDTTVLRRRITTGKLGKCARDMVCECRKCGTAICRVSLPVPCSFLSSYSLRIV
jgi:hypothetical protein